jgi:hypothetical protein
MSRNFAFLARSWCHEDTGGRGNAVSSVDFGFFMRCRKMFVEILLVPMTTVGVSNFSIHGALWHRRKTARSRTASVLTSTSGFKYNPELHIRLKFLHISQAQILATWHSALRILHLFTHSYAFFLLVDRSHVCVSLSFELWQLVMIIHLAR